ncbi:TetR/AcrR family transcriptional regulator C-terminal domain-containing protein [Rhodococcoides yunnanense]|uniref:TetR/AcrR family transcriptional regulator C-terminal domain-containing protein n=1 Tax=Rhodococcoides yunnanense TaxID=278209 RepID=UPI0009329962|nr:TetR/AcrR family transcriptional regulator C-terminal domain-containing protein [Rhodococcus yunnanensis]
MPSVEPRIPSAAPRTRGRRAGIDLDLIIEAARSLSPADLTMQAVADRLGVDRKSVNHHVTDRDTLLALVAREAFLEHFVTVRIDADATWQSACRTYAAGLVESIVAAGPLAGRLRLDESRAATYIESSEAVVSKLLGAGLDDEAALRHLVLLTNICMAYARDVHFAAVRAESRRSVLVRTAIAESDSARFPNLARMTSAGIDTYDSSQLQLGIEMFIRGLESTLDNAELDDAEA